MKKSMFILLLCLIQAACSSQWLSAGDDSVLLSFEQIGAEISVTHETADEVITEPRSAALNPVPTD